MHLTVLKMVVLKNNVGLKLTLTNLSIQYVVSQCTVCWEHGLLKLNQGQFMSVQDVQEIKNLPKNFLVKIP